MNLKELVEFMAKNLVEDQSQVDVKVNDERNFVMVELRSQNVRTLGGIDSAVSGFNCTGL